jgi:hypothetical protein
MVENVDMMPTWAEGIGSMGVRIRRTCRPRAIVNSFLIVPLQRNVLDDIGISTPVPSMELRHIVKQD